MNPDLLADALRPGLQALEAALAAPATYWQVGAVVAAFVGSGLLARQAPKTVRSGSAPQRLLVRANTLLWPLFALPLLMVTVALCQSLLGHSWLAQTATVLTLMVLFDAVVRRLGLGPLLRVPVRWGGLLLIALHFSGALEPMVAILEGMSLQLGNLTVSAAGLLRVLIFGSLLFWLGWVSSGIGLTAIRSQENLDVRTREVLAKLFQILVSVVVLLLFLQVMGINLTALAVFGGALGVGLGFGLQSIASNFVSGIIILFDRSLSVGDYVELDDGKSGFVRELTMRYTTLEGFDGKDVLVPNEAFITKTFANWTHKNRKQRYRVDFSVAYDTDIRALCQIIREAVATHPQVLSGPDLPFEERPDCEIDSFGDSGVNLFVEFWMVGIDDGPNRVGGDLLLLIFETLREHKVEIPFPQREVRVLPERNGATAPGRHSGLQPTSGPVGEGPQSAN